MERYYTLWGQLFVLATLTLEERLAIKQIQEADSALPDDAGFLSEARYIIRKHFPTYMPRNYALSGAVGGIYRDLWYRRQVAAAEAISPEEAARIRLNIRTHPARLVHDCMLDVGISVRDFARQVEVPATIVEEIARCFTAHSEEARGELLTIPVLQTLLERLGLSAGTLYVAEPYTRHGGRSRSSAEVSPPPTWRERLLLYTFIAAARELAADPSNIAAVDTLAQRLAHLYNGTDVQFCDALVKFVAAVAHPALALYDPAELLLTPDLRDALDAPLSADAQRIIDRWRDVEWGRALLLETLSQ